MYKWSEFFMKLNRDDKLIVFKAMLLVIILLIVVIIACYYLPKAVSASSSTVVENKLLPIYCVKTDKPVVALSFDAAWDNSQTEQILDILDKNDIKVTFFMTGAWISKYPEDVKEIAKRGHELGNHSDTHKMMSRLKRETIIDEIKNTHNKVKELTGIDMKVFRPPYGDYNDTLVATACSLDYYVIQWDVDSLDWKDYGANSIINTVCNHKHLGNGSIILMHNGAKYTPEALDTVIKTLKEKGFEFVTMSELVIQGEYRKDYTCDHEGRQILIDSK